MRVSDEPQLLASGQGGGDVQCSADAFEIAFQRVHLDMVHVARLDDAYPLLADPQGLRQSLLGDVFGLAGSLSS